MRDTMDILADILEDLNGIGHVSNPRIVELQDFDFTKHKPQDCGIEGIKTEFVCQTSSGMSEDDFHSTIGYPVDGRMFVVNCDT